MQNLKSIEDTAKKWATSHLIAAAAVACAIGFVIGAVLF